MTGASVRTRLGPERVWGCMPSDGVAPEVDGPASSSLRSSSSVSLMACAAGVGEIQLLSLGLQCWKKGTIVTRRVMDNRTSERLS